MPEGMQLWMASAPEASPERFFLVPRGLRLPSGSLSVRNLQLGLQEVDEEGIEPFEVTAIEAQAHIDAGWSGFVGSVRDAAARVLGSAGEAIPDPASWLGMTPGEAIVDPEKRRQGGRSLLSRVGSLIGRPLDEEEIDRVESQLQGVRDTLTSEGGRLMRSLEEAADAVVGAATGAARPEPRQNYDEDEEERP